jgi:cytochrome c peroxidase
MKTVKRSYLSSGVFPGIFRLVTLTIGFVVAQATAFAQIPLVDPVADPVGLRVLAKRMLLDSLKNTPVPIPSNIADFVKDQQAAIALGKALFWDEQAGSDGMACASCHFHAGADSRSKNQIAPGFIGGNGKFDPLPSGPGSGGPNYALKRADFPFHRKRDERSNAVGTNVLFDTDDVASSAGVMRLQFVGLGDQIFRRTQAPIVTQDIQVIRKLVASGIVPSSSLNASILFGGAPSARPAAQVPRVMVPENVSWISDTLFSIAAAGKSLNTRRVEPRNTPTVINAVFNHRNFWDGRANFHFNGRSPFGPRDAGAKVFRNTGFAIEEVPILLDNASLASQAVGPTLSPLEMSSEGRNFFHVGRKLLSSTPLGGQTVAATDSVLGAYANSSPASLRKGLKVGYAELIQRAFVDSWWNSSAQFVVDGTSWSHLEANFSMFWGLAIMMYERTLVSDQTPFDRFMEGDNNALTPQERTGLGLFVDQAGCVGCHHGAEFTAAATSQLRQVGDPSKFVLLERMFVDGAQQAIYDNGFYNINVRPTGEDVGIAGTDSFGKPLSFSLQATVGPVVDNVEANGGRFADPNEFPARTGTAPIPNERVLVLGAFKTPGLRNVDLTGPYFHTGSYLTLEQVVQFYARGTDFLPLNRQLGILSDGEVFGLPDVNGNRKNLRAIAAFLRTLTDPRVAFERAPFDRPSLRVPNGHTGAGSAVTEDPNLLGTAKTAFINLPAVGATGNTTRLQPFLGGSQLNRNNVPQDDGLRLR